MKKLAPLFLIPLLCLSSCGNDSPVGMYNFVLGRQGEGETRVGVEVELTDVKYEIPEESKSMYTREELAKMENAKQFSFSLDLGSVYNNMLEVMGIERILNGYYLLLDEYDAKYGRKMALGIDFSLADGIDLPITSSLIRNLVVSYVGGGKVTLQLPVSFEDLQHQLCWYSGTYFDFDPYIKSKIHSIDDLETYFFEILSTLKYYDLEKYGVLPGKEGDARFGTHPEYVVDDDDKVIRDDVAEMNKQFAGLFSNTFVYSVDDEGLRGDLIGSVYETVTSETETIKHFYPLNGFRISEDGLFKAIVVSTDVFGDKEDVVVDVQVTLSDSHDIVYMKNDGQMINIDEIMVDDFTFRDFHDIKVQLSKE